MSATAVSTSKRRLGSTTANSWRTWGTVSAGDFFPQPAPQPEPGSDRQQTQGEVVMPADPAAHFVVVHPQFALALQDGRLDRPPHAAGPDQALPRRLGWCIGHIALQLGRVVPCAAEHDP